MNSHIIDFQYFLAGLILLSNTQYLHFSLIEIRENSMNHQNFVHKCLLYSLYIMFIAIFYVIKHFVFDTIQIFNASMTTTLLIVCLFFFMMTTLVLYLFNKKLKKAVHIFDYSVITSFIILFAYIMDLITNKQFYYAVFICYTLVNISFFFNIFILKKKRANLGLYFLFASFFALTYINIIYDFLPFNMLITVDMAINALIIYAFFLFYSQYYVEALETSYDRVVEHVSELKVLNEKISVMAYQDPLTKVPNESAFMHHLETTETNLSLLMINVRNFSSFNQILGFNQGNALLQKIAEQLDGFCKFPNRLFKLYSDKFIISMYTENLDCVLATARKIQSIYHNESIMNFRLEIGIGVTQFDYHSRHSDSLSDVLSALEIACMRSLEHDDNIFILPLKTYLSEKATFNLEYHLREAIEQKNIEVFYQPQVSSKTKEIISFEALARWQHGGQFISPEIFIPLAETTGLISNLTRLILETIFTTLMQDNWNKGKKVSINLSSIQLVESGFIQFLLNAIEQYAIKPSDIIFEITETALLYDLEKVEESIYILKQLGFEISLDDFGTGYSSLHRFSKLNFDEVKFDKFFIQQMEKDEKLKIVFDKTVELFNTLNLRIVVEGVETLDQVQLLDCYAIDIYQGYYFGRPIPLSTLKLL